MLSGGPLDSFVPGEDSRAAGPPPGGAVSAPGTCWCCRSCKWVVTVSVRVPTSSGSDSSHPDTLAGPLFWAAQWLDTRNKTCHRTCQPDASFSNFLFDMQICVVNEAHCRLASRLRNEAVFSTIFSCSNRPLSGCNATNDPSDQNSSHSQRERRQNTNLKESLASNKNVSSAEVRVRADGENIFQKIVKNPQKFFKLIKLIELSLRIFFGLF